MEIELFEAKIHKQGAKALQLDFYTWAQKPNIKIDEAIQLAPSHEVSLVLIKMHYNILKKMQPIIK